MARVVAEYRVRAEGPRGKGAWCEPLRVDLLVPAADGGEDRLGLPSEDFGGEASGGASGDGSGIVSSVTYAAREERGAAPPLRQPMDFLRPGARARCSLTGDARRPRMKERGGAVAAARMIDTAAAERNQQPAGSGNQLWWGESLLPTVPHSDFVGREFCFCTYLSSGIRHFNARFRKWRWGTL